MPVRIVRCERCKAEMLPGYGYASDPKVCRVCDSQVWNDYIWRVASLTTYRPHGGLTKAEFIERARTDGIGDRR